jgi:hypothetical protein
VIRFTLMQVFLFWILGCGALALLTRRRAADIARRTRVPRILAYYLLVTPAILVEEAFTIEVPYFWGILPMILVFYILFFPLYLVQRYSRCSFILASLLFGAMGVFNEFILVGRIYVLRERPAVLLILCALCFLIYAVMAIWPTYYLQAAVRKEGEFQVPSSRFKVERQEGTDKEASA